MPQRNAPTQVLIALRVMEGIFEGVTCPAFHAVLGRWVPPHERTKYAQIVAITPRRGATPMPVWCLVARRVWFRGRCRIRACPLRPRAPSRRWCAWRYSRAYAAARPTRLCSTCGAALAGTRYSTFAYLGAQVGTIVSNVLSGYASRAVQFHPHGGQSDFVWLSARTPHGAYVW